VAQQDVQNARTALDTLRNTTATRLDEMAEAASALEQAKRTSVDLPGAQERYNTAVTRYVDARQAEAGGRQALQTAISTFVGGFSDGGEVATVETYHPIVLFPVRIETRFDLAAASGPVLRVRVYPDEILANDFEERLTRAEEVAGLRYWAAAPDVRRTPWNNIAARFGAERAAWIVKKTSTLPNPGDEVTPRGPYRPEAYSRAVEANLLPDRWIVVGQPIGGGAAVTKAGGAIREPLALTLDPNAPVGPDDVVNDDELLWTVDYQRALQVGMAIDVPLAPGRGLEGFRQLVVVGVKASLAPLQTVTALTKLFAGHRFGRGFDFVRQGTPTNNTTDRPSGYPRPDHEDHVYHVEAAGASNAPVSNDGYQFLDFFGLDIDLAPYETWRITRAAPRGRLPAPDDEVDLGEQAAARNMNRALWPGTWGYYLQHMMDVPGGTPILTDEVIEQARDHFIEQVRARGPVPAFRIGGTPYGVLPISSLDAWEPGAGASLAKLPEKLRKLRDRWRLALPEVPRIKRNSATPDADLIDVLGQHPSTREVRVRPVIGEAAWFNLLWIVRLPWAPWTDEQRRRAREVFGRIGEPDWRPRVSRTVIWPFAHLFKDALVGAEPLSEVDGPASRAGNNKDYLEFLGTSSLSDILAEEARAPNLLYRVLRHSVLTEHVRLAWGWVKETQQKLRFPFELLFPTTYKSIWTWLKTEIDTPDGRMTVATWLATSDKVVAGVRPPTAHRNALVELGQLPDAELERLFSETLDLCSHRLDAWITSLFTARLRGLRVVVDDVE